MSVLCMGSAASTGCRATDSSLAVGDGSAMVEATKRVIRRGLNCILDVGLVQSYWWYEME